MQGSNGFDNILGLSREGQLRKSAFLSESEALRKERDFDSSTSRKLVTASTYLHPTGHSQQHFASPRRTFKHATDLPRDHPPLNNSTRPLTYRSGEGKTRPQAESTEKSAHEDFNSHLVQLKMEEMAFKFKSRIGTLLKEIGISVFDLTRFTSLAKIDDILNFLSEKVKEKLTSSEITETNVTKIRSKQRELLADHEGQIESLKKRLQQKEGVERAQKAKLKENHGQMRDLYDKLNLKEKELSNKMTELYQSRTLTKENEKLIETLQAKNAQLDKERTELRETLENCNREVSNTHRATEEQNEQLRSDVEELKQALEMAAEKEVRLLEANQNMAEEVARWRERFEEEREKGSDRDRDSTYRPDTPQSQHHDATGSAIKLTADHDPSRLLARNQQLQYEIKRLQNQITALSSYKEKYESVASLPGRQKEDNSDLLKLQNIKHHSADLYKLQVEAYYSKKMEVMSTEWRDKLIDLVDSYTAEEESLRKEITQLEEEKKALEKKVFVLANEKYLADCRVIEKESELYQMARTHRNSRNNQEMYLPSEELLISTPEIQPLHESIKFNEQNRTESPFNQENHLRPSKETYSIQLERSAEP